MSGEAICGATATHRETVPCSFEPDHEGQHSWSQRITERWTRDQLTVVMRAWVAEHGRAPTLTEWKDSRLTPSWVTFQRAFGVGWVEMLALMGLAPNARSYFGERRVCKCGRAFRSRLGYEECQRCRGYRSRTGRPWVPPGERITSQTVIAEHRARHALVLRYEGFTNQQIAAHLGASKPAIANLLQRRRLERFGLGARWVRAPHPGRVAGR